MKILVIDQDTAILEMLQISLSRAGHRVRIAVDGNAGLRLAQVEKPNLIILDMLLPSIDGFEVCRQLKENPITESIPIFLISALNLPTINEIYTNNTTEKDISFYSAYHPKPLNLPQFLREVEALLKPEEATKPVTGPDVLVIIKDNVQRVSVKKVLVEKNFVVHVYADMIKPLSAMRVSPSVLVIDEVLLSAHHWAEIKSFQERTPNFTLIVLQNEASAEPPAYLSHVNYLLPPPAYSWQVGIAVEQATNFSGSYERIKNLSKSLLELNTELRDTKTTLLAQNKELDFVNRRMHRLGELKETLTGMLVHDLKAPLSSMMGALQFITMDPENAISESSHKFISGGLAAGKQMIRLTYTLLDEQRLENNQLVFDIEPISFRDITNTITEMMGPLFTMHKVHSDIRIPDDLPLIAADPIILQRIAENLLDNAVKHSPTNQPIIIIAREVGDLIEICIADRGDGIPPEHREVIFDRFEQLENVKLEKVRGSVGLGLTFCKMAVENMGGEIWVDSLDDIGAAFHFTIPIFKPETNE